jgi:hypothetical protein
MPVLIGRFLNATKNADGTVTLEFGLGGPNASVDLTVMKLTAAEATALDAVLTGVTGTKSQSIHGTETASPGYHR